MHLFNRREREIMGCHYCNTSIDLRPYGPQGTMVCFNCAMSTPERQAETERNFYIQLEACGPYAVIDSTETGTYPLQHNPKAMQALTK